METEDYLQSIIEHANAAGGIEASPTADREMRKRLTKIIKEANDMLQALEEDDS